MSSYIHNELLLFFQSVFMGAMLLFCYSFFTALRRVLPHHPAAVIAEDLFYWISAGIWVFVRIYTTNQGILRSFLFLGLLLGAVLCNELFRPLFVRICAGILAIPVVIAKKIINRLLFCVKRCKILMSNLAKKRKKRQNKKKSRLKRGRKFGKIRKKGQEKENRV